MKLRARAPPRAVDWLKEDEDESGAERWVKRERTWNDRRNYSSKYKNKYSLEQKDARAKTKAEALWEEEMRSS